MNIQMQICALLLNVMVQALFFCRRSLKLRTTGVFTKMLVLDCISIILDMSSVILIQTGVSALATNIVNRAYLISVIWLAYLTFQYLIVDVEMRSASQKAEQIAIKVIMLIATVILCVLPIGFASGSAFEAYAYGKAVNFTYGVCGFIILAICASIFMYLGHLSVSRIQSLIVCVITIATAGIVQFINHSFLIMGFASALCVALIFILLENPESYMDRDSGCYNTTALFAYMNEHYINNERFSILGLHINNLHFLNENYALEDVKDLLNQIAEVISHEEGAYVCKRTDWEYIMVFDKQEDMRKCSDSLQARFDNAWMIGGDITRVDVSFTEVPDSLIVNDSEEMYDLFRKFGKGIKKDPDKEKVTYITKEIVDIKRYRKSIEKEINDAIEEDRVETFYQPIYSTAKKHYVSAEVLMRIRKKDGSLMYPNEFIPIAESTGQIIRLGEIVFRKACQFIVDSKPEQHGIEYLEINLSAVQSSRAELADEFIAIMDEVGVDPKMINLEITESAAITSKENLANNIEQLEKYGVTFSLDDFGTGYSNIEYIMELPIEIVKFDKTLTQAYFVDEHKKMIMEKVIKMIRSAHFKIVSEGVEEKEQLAALTDMNIDYIQGYYFSKPVEQDVFTDMLKQESA